MDTNIFRSPRSAIRNAFGAEFLTKAVHLFWVLGYLGLWVFLPGCGKSSQTSSSADVPLYFTCDVHGRLVPCGCFIGQFGGLDRLKTVLDAEAPPGSVRVDVGDAIGGHEDYDVIQYRYLLRAYSQLKYDALNLGHREAALSLAQLKELKQTSPVPMLSANLFEKSTGKPIFDAYRIVERNGFRIALIGVLDPRGLGQDLGNGLAVGDMSSAISKCLAELRGKADLIVLLAFTDEDTMGQLAQQFYELHVILGGKVRQPAQELRRENRSLIYFVTNESRALGILHLHLVRNASPAATANEIRLLHDKIPENASIQALNQNYRDEIRRAKLAVDDPNNLGADMVPGVRAAATYVGTYKCLGCHKDEAAVWKNSRHANAFGTLIQHGADADPKCVSCHTIGFGVAGGYRRELGVQKLVNVGCESCHGPGSLHVRRREGDNAVDFVYRPLDAGDCRKCHYGEFSRPFDWKTFWPPVRHGKVTQTALNNN